MSASTKEVPITDRVEEHPSAQPGKVRQVRARELGIRFIAGALTSIASGALTLALGSRVGGILLAFPAILGASLTLIEQKEDRAEAREDARGAVIGGAALAVFAAIAALSLGALNGAIALLMAAAGWFAAAALGYALAWFE